MPSLIINGVLAVLSPAAWIALLVGASDPERLMAHGWRSLKYFTVLSNLLCGLASALYLASRLAMPAAPAAAAAPAWVLALKLAATSAVTLTFLVVIALLCPKFGWRQMYAGGNLFMHLLLPLLAIADCVLFVPLGVLPPAATVAAVVLCALYGTWYLRMVMSHIAEDGGKAHDFYGFLRWGEGKIAVVFTGMLAVSWATGLALWLASGALCHA